jgi:hypothetical protein
MELDRLDKCSRSSPPCLPVEGDHPDRSETLKLLAHVNNVHVKGVAY